MLHVGTLRCSNQAGTLFAVMYSCGPCRCKHLEIPTTVVVYVIACNLHSACTFCALILLIALQGRNMNREAFKRAFLEYSRFQADSRLYLQQINDLECPACSEGLTAVHVDANMKLFTWDRKRELWRKPYHQQFFVPDEDVVNHIAVLDKVLGSKVCACASPARSPRHDQTALLLYPLPCSTPVKTTHAEAHGQQLQMPSRSGNSHSSSLDAAWVSFCTKAA